MDQAPQQSRRGCRRAGCGCAGVSLAAALLLAAAAWWGAPLSWAVRAGLDRATGGGAALESLRLWPAIELRGLALRGPGAFEPVAAFDAVRVDYALRPADGRRIARVTLEQPRLLLDVAADAAPNYDFLLPGTAPPPAATPTAAFQWPPIAWIPRDYRVTGAEIRARAPRGEFLVRGVNLEARLDAWDAAHLRVDAAPLAVAWRLPGEPEWSEAAGPFRVDTEMLDGAYHLDLRADVTGLAAAISAAARDTPEGGAADIAIDHLRLDTWTDAVAQWSPVPLAFTRATVDDSRLALAWSPGGVVVDAARLAAAVQGLRVGGRDTTGWALGDPDSGQPPLDATILVDLRRDEATHRLDAELLIDDRAAIAAAGWIRDEDGARAFDITVPGARLDGALMAAAPPGALPNGMRFDQATLRDARAAGTARADGADLDALRAALRVDGIDLGDAPVPGALAPLRELVAPALAVDLDATRLAVAPGRLAFDGRAAIGEAVRVDGALDAARDGTDWRVDALLRDAALAGPAWARAIAPHAPLPVDFAALTLRDAALRGNLAGVATALDTARFTLAARALRLGPPEAPWYAGDPVLEAAGTLKLLVAEGRATLRPAPDQALGLSGKAGPAGADLAFTLDSGPRARWAALVPDAYRPWLAYAPALGRVAGEGTLRSGTGGLRAAAVMTATLDTGAGARLALETTLPPGQHADGTPLPWPTAMPETLRARVDAALGGATAAFDAAHGPGPRIELRGDVADLDPAAILRDWLAVDPLAGLEARGGGRVEITGPPAGPYAIAAETTWTGLAYAPFAWPEAVEIGVLGDIAASLDRLDARRAGIRLDADSHATLTDTTLAYDPPAIRGRIEADLGAAFWERLFDALGYEALVARIAGAATVDATPGQVRLQPELAIHTPWIAEAGLPASLPLAIAADEIVLDPAAWSGRARGLRVEVEEKIAFDAPELGAAWNGGAPNARIPAARVRLGALPFAHWLFDRAIVAGEITLTDFALDAGVPSGTVEVALDADLLVLSGGLAKVTGASLRGSFQFTAPTHPDGPLGPWVLAGTGELRAASATSGGVNATDLAGTLTLGPGSLAVDITGGDLYDGLVDGLVTMDLTRDTFRTRADLRFDRADLATFTREFEPPQVRLTGLAGGTVGIEIDRYGVLDISGHLASTEGFTMNRDMVQRLLMYDQIGGFYGGKQLSRALDRVLGGDPQRPFDSATADLRYAGAWLTLDTVLRSKAAHTLNIEVETTLDPVNLYNFLSEQQAAAVAGLDSLDAGL